MFDGALHVAVAASTVGRPHVWPMPIHSFAHDFGRTGEVGQFNSFGEVGGIWPLPLVAFLRAACAVFTAATIEFIGVFNVPLRSSKKRGAEARKVRAPICPRRSAAGKSGLAKNLLPKAIRSAFPCRSRSVKAQRNWAAVAAGNSDQARAIAPVTKGAATLVRSAFHGNLIRE